jgi:hypothetical protein
MAGLIAVIGNGPSVASEISGLSRAYFDLRGERRDVALASESCGAVASAGEHEPRACVEKLGSAWSVSIGAVHGPPRILGAQGSEMDGQFALVRYEPAGQLLEAITDPFGMQALYLAQRGGLTYLSTSALALAKHLRVRPSRLGVEMFLRSGPHFGELTSWEGIRRVPPATRLSFVRGSQAASEVYWQPRVDGRVARLGLAEAAEYCMEVAIEVLRARYANLSRGWCDITGGFDSRLLSLLLRDAGAGFATNTVGEWDSEDVVLGRRVANLAGLPWVCGEPNAHAADRAREAIREAVAWGDGQMDAVQLAGVLAWHRRLAGSGRTLFAGGGGGVWRDYAWQQEGPLGGRTRRVNFDRWVATRFLHAFDLSAFRSDPTPRVREVLIERCRSYAAPYAAECNSAQLDMLLAHKCIGHDGAYQTATRGVLSMELPYFTKTVFETPFSVAPKHRNLHRLMRHAIWRLDRAVAAVPTTSGGPAEPLQLGNAARFVPYLLHRGQGAARKLTQNLPGPTIGRLPDETDPKELAVRRLALDDVIERTGLHPARMRSGALYDQGRLRAFANSPSALARNWPLLGRIITVELALEMVGAEVD